MLNVVNNYLRNIGSALHHAMKHGKALHVCFNVNVQRFYHQHLVRKLWKSEQKQLFDAPCGVNCFALCVNVVNNRRPPENLGFSTWLKIFTTKSEQKSDVKMNNLHCKWGKVIGAFYLKLNLLLSAPTVLSVFKPSKGPFTHFNGEFAFE